MFLCLFPFEIEFYKKRSLPAHFVGHPILDRIPEIDERNLRPARVEAMIGLLPGSRVDEIKRHLPIMAEACEMIQKQNPGTRFILFTVPNINRDLYKSILTPRKGTLLIEMVQDESYVWRSQIDIALTASGMETLENTLLGIPMVIMYQTDWLTYAVAMMVINIKYLGMPNLLAGKEIVPEFLQRRATAANIARPVLTWLKEPETRKNVCRQLLGLRKLMGGQGASERAARLILEKVA
jgi:lipid-A-disaccharide synthase